MTRLDVASFLLRSGLGAMIFLHGANKWKSADARSGTAAWFASIGMRAPKFQTSLAAFAEMTAGILLVLGLFVPTASGALIATMIVAIVVAHRKNGFFIFNEGQGWEYCGIVSISALAVAGLGGGRMSLDHVFGVDYGGTWGFVTALVVAVGTTIAHLLTSYRPRKPS